MPSPSPSRPPTRPTSSASSALTSPPSLSSADEAPPAPTPPTSERPSSVPPRSSEVAHRPCLVCKKRRGAVRCGRELPTCTRCEKRGDRCRYPPRASTASGPPASTPKLQKLANEKGKETEQEEEEAHVSSASQDQIEDRVSAASPAPQVAGGEAEAANTGFPSPPTLPSNTPLPLATLSLPIFPRSLPTAKHKMAREAREALTRVVTFGAEAELEKAVGLIGGGRLDLTKMYIDLANCDAAYLSSTFPPLLSPLPFLPSPNSTVPLEPSTTLTANQAHLALTAYFRSIEPSLALYTSSSSRLGFQDRCLELWRPSLPAADGDTPKEETTRPKGWWAMYLATVAVGLMAVSKGDLKKGELPQDEGERGDLARGLAEEAARSLGQEGFATVPTLEGLRASLLLLTYELGGLSSMPDIPSTLCSLPLIVSAAYELRLNRERLPGDPAIKEDEKEEKRKLWWKVFELESAWSPLLARRLSLVPPSSFSTRPALVPSPTSGHTPAPSPLQSALVFTNKLSNLLNSPHTLTPLDFVPLVDQFEQLPPTAQVGEEQDVLTGLVRKAAGLRLRAVRDEVGEKTTEEEKKRWEELAYDLLTTPPSLVLQVDRFQQLLATSTFFHSLVLIALRLSLSPSPGSTLRSAFPTLLSSLKSTPWPMHLHKSVRRGLIVLEHLVPSFSSVA